MTKKLEQVTLIRFQRPKSSAKHMKYDNFWGSKMFFEGSIKNMIFSAVAQNKL